MTTTETKLKILLKHLAVRCRFYFTSDTVKPEGFGMCLGANESKRVKCKGNILKCEYDEEKDGVIE